MSLFEKHDIGEFANDKEEKCEYVSLPMIKRKNVK